MVPRVIISECKWSGVNWTNKCGRHKWQAWVDTNVKWDYYDVFCCHCRSEAYVRVHALAAKIKKINELNNSISKKVLRILSNKSIKKKIITFNHKFFSTESWYHIMTIKSLHKSIVKYFYKWINNFNIYSFLWTFFLKGSVTVLFFFFGGGGVGIMLMSWLEKNY